MVVVHVGSAVTRAVGKPVVRLFCAVPAVFGLVCAGGVALGVFLTRVSVADDPHPMLVRGIGVGIALFYVGVGAMWLVKVYRRTWREFRGWWLDVLDRLPGDV